MNLSGSLKSDRETFGGSFFSLSVIILTGILVVFSCRLSAAAREIIVGVYDNEPKVFIEESGKPSGIFIDIIEYIAEQENWNIRYVRGTWSEGLDRLVKREIDLMPDVAYTTAREEIYDFHSEPVLSDWFHIYARKDAGLKSIVDLNDKRIVVLEKSVQQAAFEHMVAGFGLNITINALPDYKSIFELVASGKADAAVTNRFYGQVHAKKYGLEDTAVIFNPTHLFFAAPKNSDKSVLNAINRHLVNLKKDSQSIYYRSLKSWTSETVSFKLPTFFKVAVLFACAALFISLTGSYILKRQVNARTRELQTINQEMEERIKKRTFELAEAMERAQTADRLKSTFLATMSHELRTPLNSIIGFTGIILQGLTGPLNEEQNKQLRMVQDSARHLLALINDVLDISKIEAGQLSLSNQSFNLRNSICKMADLVYPMAKKKGLVLKLDISDDISDYFSDQRRLEQVILNLFNNAVKFTEKGEIRISCRIVNGTYVISVADTGIGIRAEDISALFQPFHQIDSGLSRKHEGTGLGLSISKKLIDMMNGNIEVSSRPGEGSTFSIILPQHSGGES